MHQSSPTASDLGFKKISRRETPGPPLLRGPLRGGGGRGEGGGRGREGRGGNVEGPGKWSAQGPTLALGGPGRWA